MERGRPRPRSLTERSRGRGRPRSIEGLRAGPPYAALQQELQFSGARRLWL